MPLECDVVARSAAAASSATSSLQSRSRCNRLSSRSRSISTNLVSRAAIAPTSESRALDVIEAPFQAPPYTRFAC
jgi:hypothetical protein